MRTLAFLAAFLFAVPAFAQQPDPCAAGPLPCQLLVTQETLVQAVMAQVGMETAKRLDKVAAERAAAEKAAADRKPSDD